MPQEGKPDYLALRVLDNNTGAEVVQNLFHLHQTEWQVRALQQGMPGSSTLGTFRILLPPPYTEEGKRYRSDFLKLAIGQRVEGYLGGVITSQRVQDQLGNTISGSPRFSGIITGMSRPLDGPWEVTGVDSLWMLQQSQVLPGEAIIVAGNTGWRNGNAFSGTQEVVWDDDFSGWNGSVHPNSSDYTGNGGFSPTTDPVFGLACLKATTDSSFAVTTTSWGSSAQYVASTVTIHGVAVANAGANTGLAIGPGIFLLSDATAQNAYEVEFRMQQTAANSGLYNVSLVINSWSAGVATQQANVANVFTNVAATFPFELTAVMCYIPSGASGAVVAIRALLNGKDPSCVFSNFAPIASGRIGLRSGGALGTTYVNRLQFHGRTSGVTSGGGFGTNRFSFGANFLGNFLTQSLTGAGQTHLDMITASATFDGVGVRKTPGYGYKADLIEYGTSGTDYSASAVLEEGVNIVARDTKAATVPEMLASDVRVNALPGTDSGGSITWGRIGNAGDAALTDTVADMGIPGYTLLVNYGRQVQARKVNPLQAYQVRIIRTADWLGAPNTLGAGPRELDTVLVTIPTLGVNQQKLVIMGYDFVEGDATQVFYLSQLPEAAAPLHLIQRIMRPIEYLGTNWKGG